MFYKWVDSSASMQGSVLGPLLFLLYNINDINSSSKDGLFVLFADDTNIFVSDKSRK